MHTMSRRLERDENFAAGELRGEDFKHGDAGKEGDVDEDDKFDAMYTSAGQEMVEEELESKSDAQGEAEDKMQLLGISGDATGSPKDAVTAKKERLRAAAKEKARAEEVRVAS